MNFSAFQRSAQPSPQVMILGVWGHVTNKHFGRNTGNGFLPKYAIFRKIALLAGSFANLYLGFVHKDVIAIIRVTAYNRDTIINRRLAILIPLMINGISTCITDKNKRIISFVIVIFIGRIILGNDFFNHVVPWNILREFSRIETGAGGNDLCQPLFSVANSVLVTLVMDLTCYFTGKGSICRMNLWD